MNTSIAAAARVTKHFVLVLLLTAIPTIAAPHEFQAGSARADITPPPGLPTGGHGPVGAVARGHLTRLYARAIFFRDSNDYPLLLVSVESFAVPPVFRAEVQQRFEQATNIRLPLESIIIAATHTHQGPGNYFSAAAINNLGSPIKGFIPELREFLINQIVQASVAAYKNSTSVSLSTRQALLPPQLLRNRSPQTFMLNRNANQIMDDLDQRVKDLGGTVQSSDPKLCVKAQQPREQEGEWDIDGCPRLRAVDREITILDVIDSKGTVVATLIFGAMHPTVAPAETPLFSSDFVGLAMRQLELEDSSGKRVAAFFNGPEGDITARRVDRDVRDIWHHALWLRQAIDNARNATPLDVSTGIESRMHFAAPGEVLVGTNVRFGLASEPMAGAALVGGGEGDRTPLYQLGWKEGVTDFRATSEQGAKLNAFKSRLLPFLPDLTDLLAGPDDFPQALPLGYAHLGTLEIVSTPSEMSTATGYNIRKALHSSDRIVIIGLANEYASYTATADEYARQDYMAASTLWGPQESDFFVLALSKLKAGPLPSDATPQDFPGLGSGKLKPFDVGARRQAVDEDLDLLLRNGKRNAVRDLPYFTWEDEGPIDKYAEASGTTVAIEHEDGTLFEDDTAGRLVVLLREKPQAGVRQWAAIWLAPLDDTLLTGRVRFRVKTAAGTCYKSALFAAASDKRDRGAAIVVACPKP